MTAMQITMLLLLLTVFLNTVFTIICLMGIAACYRHVRLRPKLHKAEATMFIWKRLNDTAFEFCDPIKPEHIEPLMDDLWLLLFPEPPRRN